MKKYARSYRTRIRLNVPRPGGIILSDGSVYPCRILNASRRGAQVIVDLKAVLRRFILIDNYAQTERAVQITQWGPDRLFVKYLDGRFSDKEKIMTKLRRK